MQEPFVSVLMPIRNEEKYIQRSLDSVLSQNYPADRIEIIIIDGMSVDGTREIVSEVFNNYPNRYLQILDNPKGIVPAALNIGLRRAKGQFVVRVDGHCEISSNYILQCVSHLVNEEVECVGGLINTIGITKLGETIAVSMSTPFGVGDSTFRIGEDRCVYVDTVPFPAYTRKVMDLAGGFDEDMICNEDDEYNYRLRKLGMKILITSDINSSYYCRNSLSALWRQYFLYGMWKVRLLQKHPRQMRLRQFAPPVMVIVFLVLLLVLLVGFRSWGVDVLFLITGGYLTTNIAASFLAAANNGWRHFFLLPICYVVLHFSYGFGFLMGLLRFANRWGDNRGNTPSITGEHA